MIWFECIHSTVNTNQQAAPVTVHKSIFCKSHIDKFTAVLLRTGDDEKVKQLFYATVHLMMDQGGPKHVEVDVL